MAKEIRQTTEGQRMNDVWYFQHALGGINNQSNAAIDGWNGFLDFAEAQHGPETRQLLSDSLPSAMDLAIKLSAKVEGQKQGMKPAELVEGVIRMFPALAQEKEGLMDFAGQFLRTQSPFVSPENPPTKITTMGTSNNDRSSMIGRWLGPKPRLVPVTPEGFSFDPLATSEAKTNRMAMSLLDKYWQDHPEVEAIFFLAGTIYTWYVTAASSSMFIQNGQFTLGGLGLAVTADAFTMLGIKGVRRGADTDRSGKVSPDEAIMFGLALAAVIAGVSYNLYTTILLGPLGPPQNELVARTVWAVAMSIGFEFFLNNLVTSIEETIQKRRGN